MEDSLDMEALLEALLENLEVVELNVLEEEASLIFLRAKVLVA